MPCVPIAGKSDGHLRRAADRRRASGSSSSRATPTTRSGPAASGARRRGPGAGAAGNPVSPSIVLQTALQNSIVISDVPGPTGGIMLKSTTGAMIIGQRHRDHDQNGKGATIVMTGPTRVHQQRRAGGDLGCRMPGLLSMSAPPCCARTAGQAQPTAPNPRVSVSGQPTVTHGGAVRRRRLRPATSARLATGRASPRSGLPRRPGSAPAAVPLLLIGQPGGLRADRHAADRRDDQTRVSAQ